MYFFSETPFTLSSDFSPSSITGILSNKSSSYIALYNETQLYIFDHKYLALLGYYKRSKDSLDIYGQNIKIEWSMDSSFIAVATKKSFLLIYSMNFSDNKNEEYMEANVGFTVPVSIPSNCLITFKDVIGFSSQINSLCLFREDLIVSTNDGFLNRINWEGQIVYNEQTRIDSISFFNDLEYSKAIKNIKCDSICKSIEWFPSFNGIIILFENGKSAFLHIPNHILKSDHVTGVWADHLRHSNCVAVNVKFRSIAFGGKSGDGVIYKFDEETGALKMQHRLKISSGDFPDAEANTGAVLGLQWSPDNFCLLMYWESGSFSLWSVQGFLLFSSLGDTNFLNINVMHMDWGCEGYSLWTVCKKENYDKLETIIFKLAKSSLIMNSTLNNQRHILLLSANSMYFAFREDLINSSELLVSCKYPEIYISRNWPIKYASINDDASCIGISGKYGFALYFTKNRKWRMFGNEIEEKTIEVIGGMVWIKHILCVAVYENKKEEFQIRLYNSERKIDETSSLSHPVTSQIMILNSYRETIITLSINGLITLYALKTFSNDKLSIELCQIISLENYIDFAACVVSIHLSSLDFEIGSDNENGENNQFNSILVNYSGHLLMFHRNKYYHSKKCGKYLKTNSVNEKDSVNDHEVNFNGPIVIAYDVENIWIPFFRDENKSSMMNSRMYTMENALWLNCGTHGLKVWLPLKNNSPTKGESKCKNSFLSKRIMLACRISDFFPLVVLNNQMLLLSPFNDFSSNSQSSLNPHLKIKRHIFIHHIIKQLLRINLGVHALELTNDLKSLSYFNHALELLLHEILEEEATSKEPIPDPLLPRVIAFIQEFPDYLKTIVQCARKTELALWPYLFDSAGDPKDLFETCLINNQPEVAASYLVILQNTESQCLSQKHALVLMHASLYQRKWKLVKDLLRFLRNIALNESKIQNNNSKGTNLSNVHPHKRRYRSGGCSGRIYSVNTHSKFNDCNNFKESDVNTESVFKEVFVETGNSHDINSKGFLTTKSTPPSLSEGHLQVYQHSQPNFLSETSEFAGLDSIKASNLIRELDQMITHFVHYLFAEYKINDLFELVANVHFSENQFINWLDRERGKCSKILNPLEALNILHIDFNWNPVQTNQNSPMNTRDNLTIEKSQYTILQNISKLNQFNEVKLKYILNVFTNAKYLEWVILILIMLDDYKQIHDVFEHIDQSISKNISEFLKQLIQKVLCSDKYIIYSQILVHFNDILSQKCFVSNPNHDKNETSRDESFLLSPSLNHDFNFGQLEINFQSNKITDDVSKLTLCENFSSDLNKPNISLKEHEDKLNSPLVHKSFNKYSKKSFQPSLSGNFEALNSSFRLSDNSEDFNSYSEPLVSIEIEDKSLKWCSLS